MAMSRSAVAKKAWVTRRRNSGGGGGGGGGGGARRAVKGEHPGLARAKAYLKKKAASAGGLSYSASDRPSRKKVITYKGRDMWGPGPSTSELKSLDRSFARAKQRKGGSSTKIAIRQDAVRAKFLKRKAKRGGKISMAEEDRYVRAMLKARGQW